jgi:hypothetical protein
MDELQALQDRINRRIFLKRGSGLGLAALFSLLGVEALGQTAPLGAKRYGGLKAFPSLPVKTKRVIYLFQSGGPSQMELFDPKPGLEKLRGEDLPNSVRNGQRLTGMTSGQTKFPVAPNIFKYSRYGQSGIWLSELMPHLGAVADECCFIHSMFTDAINHDPAVTFFQTGSQIVGRPSIGSWLSYGLGSQNRDLPAYTVLTSVGAGRSDQPLYDRLWGSGFLPTQHQGVKLRNTGDPVVYLSDPEGIDRSTRREMLNDLTSLNKVELLTAGDPEISTRISQYELAFRMQSSVPELTDISKEPSSVLEMYGPEVRKHGTYAYNCLMARRLSERGVRFVQLFHMGWDQHGNLPKDLASQCRDTDQASAALVKDLKQRGLLDETLVVWGGEFGRTVYSQGDLTATNYGRDHHPRCFTVWMAGGGIKRGLSFGKTDDFSYNITENPVSVHDLHATMLHLMGIDHTQLTYRYQGRDFRLTDVFGEVVKGILA